VCLSFVDAKWRGHSSFDLKWLAGVFIFPFFFYILSRRDSDK
jgi:hypothetical protein